MDTTGRKKSDPYTNLAQLIKTAGYNKDMTLTRGTVLAIAPMTVKLDGNGLVTTNLSPLPHLLPQYYDFHIIFDVAGQEGDRERTGKIMIDDDLEPGDRVFVLYEVVQQKVNGVILGKEE